MKKINCHQDHPELPLPHKLAQNLLPKKHKQFELLYRQRDQSVEENPIESIIFVKSKPFKSASNNKKIKVHQELKNIMNDLNAHVNQHKKSHKSQKNYTSTASTQQKSPFSTKKSTKQTQFIPKKSKQNQKDQIKVLKTVNKGNQILNKQQSPIIQSVKSPKKSDKCHLSPKSKHIFSPVPQKIEKENIETKRVNTGQKIQRKKSPQQKTSRKPNFNQFEQDTSNKKPKVNPFGHASSFRCTEILAKTELKRNIRSIPLQVQEYILIEDNFERIKKRSLYKLETKLLSTYRNNFKELENKLSLKENQDEHDFVFQKLNRQFFQESNVNFIERSSFNSQSSKYKTKSQRSSEIEPHLIDVKIKQNLDQKESIKNIVTIQKWWKKMIKIEAIKAYLQRNQQASDSFKSLKKPAQERNFTTPVNIPSVNSLQFNDEVRLSEDEDTKLHTTNEEMSMLKNQNQIVRQKKNLHQKILTNLLNEKKITKDDFQNKMALVQRQYEKQLKEIMSLYKLIQFGPNSQIRIEEKSNQKDIKIIQGGKNRLSSEEQGEMWQKNNPYHPTPQNQSEEDEIPLKIYKIGDKISFQMQNYIQQAKKTRESQKVQDDFVCEKYSKKTNQLGEQYFEDFESDSSNDQSPHKMLSASNFQDFEAHVPIDNHGSSLDSNAHFIKMLQHYKENEQIKMKIDQRIALQMGAMKFQNGPQYAVDTSILGIHQFLVSFFKFYLHYYKDEFLRFINMPYGYQPEQRLKFIQGYEDTSDELSEDSDGIIYGLEYIISDDVFEQFVNQYYAASIQKGDEQQKAMVEWAKIHDRALFECFNESLNNFRPYYSISGPPYIWNSSQKTLTFYFIAQENINEVFEKTEYRVMKWASGLLGLYVDGYDSITEKDDPKTKKQMKQEKQKLLSIEEIVSKSHSSCHPLVFEKREQNLIKEEKIELIESMKKWYDIQEQRTSTLYELSSVVLQELAKELVIQFLIKSSSNPILEEFY